MARSRALGWANAVGRGLARIGIRASLEEESLLRAARRHTRLSDFGDEEFREPLRRLLEAHENEGRLSPTGRALKRLSFVDMLSSRLRVQRQIAREPRLLDEPPRRPLVVTGLPRTGTTLLQRLLSLAPDARPLRAWEAMWPAPVSKSRRGEDSRIRHARRLVWITRKVPAGDRRDPSPGSRRTRGVHPAPRELLPLGLLRDREPPAGIRGVDARAGA